MIDPNTKLTVFHDDNGSFTDYSNESADYLRDNYTVALSSTEDYLYLGFYKPFGVAYVKIITANLTSNSFTLQYYDGTTWQNLSLTDETNGFTRSGYLMWDRTNMSSTSVNSETKYYVRLRPSSDHTNTVIRGINLIFADDHALKQEFFEVDNPSLLPSGETDHVTHHVAARNAIIQNLRNLQYIKVNANGQYVNVTQWDLFDLFEIKQAATMLALSKIFFNLSDSVDDQWWAKYREYQDKYEEAFRLARLSLDQDDDGLKDANEELVKKKVYRWQR